MRPLVKQRPHLNSERVLLCCPHRRFSFELKSTVLDQRLTSILLTHLGRTLVICVLLEEHVVASPSPRLFGDRVSTCSDSVIQSRRPHCSGKASQFLFFSLSCQIHQTNSSVSPEKDFSSLRVKIACVES